MSKTLDGVLKVGQDARPGRGDGKRRINEAEQVDSIQGRRHVMAVPVQTGNYLQNNQTSKMALMTSTAHATRPSITRNTTIIAPIPANAEGTTDRIAVFGFRVFVPTSRNQSSYARTVPEPVGARVGAVINTGVKTAATAVYSP